MQCDRALPPDSRHGRPAGRGGAAARARLKPGDLGRIPLEGIGWAIAGAESGPRARPMDLDWVRSIRDQCAAAGVLFMFKQRVVNGGKISLPKLDG
jgi:protein gp37